MYYDRRRRRYRAQVYYRGPDGVRHRRYVDCRTRREALLKEEEYRLEAGSLGGETASFEAVFDDYMGRARSRLRASSLAHYARIARLHLLPFFGAMKVSAITTGDVEKWKRGLDAEGYSLQYRKHCYKVLHLVFRHAASFFGVANPAVERAGNFRRDPNAPTERRELRYWTPAEFSRWLSAISAAQEREPDSLVLEATKVLVCIGYYAGLRKGEANALRRSDYRRRKDGSRYLSVTKSVAQNLTGYGTLTTDPKTATSVRDVFVERHLEEVLDAHLRFLDRFGLSGPDCYLVYGVGPLPNTTLEAVKERYEREAGVRHIRVHDLRHSFVSNLIGAGVPIEMIAKACGHASTGVTFRTYGHLLPSSQSEMAERLAGYLDRQAKEPPK